ncbi:hypothetical protein HU200_042276 [Digitaria exilis]|uniref:Uncharacterized protein n=1 Tax=Digitaria exilis TaxID=1010633 RepID=A0A835B605_9POAL|nr:hypothetical protein HU200_042276 [Digitaria exilis]
MRQWLPLFYPGTVKDSQAVCSWLLGLASVALRPGVPQAPVPGRPRLRGGVDVGVQGGGRQEGRWRVRLGREEGERWLGAAGVSSQPQDILTIMYL